MARKKILITGAAGSIGKVMRQGLQDRYDLRLMYHRTLLPAAAGEEVFVCGITELEKLEEVVEEALHEGPRHRRPGSAQRRPRHGR